MAENNSLAWPSIEQLPREVCRKVNRFLAVADAAAATIQRRARGQQRAAPESFAGGYRHRLLHQLLGAPASTAEKLDGTNVGKLNGGTLLGRRLVIEDTATVYQRCELSTLRALNTDAALRELSLMHTPTRAALYGELCCNAGLYSYAAAGISKTWLAFGALLDFADEAAALSYASAAGEAGMVCGMSGETCVRVCNNAVFARIMATHNVPAISISREPHASLAAAVAHHAEWMVAEKGEGLVLTLEVAPGRAKLYKWKISREPQPAAVTELEELAATLRGGGDNRPASLCAAALLGDEVLRLVDTLRAVATHVDSATAAAKKPQAKKEPKRRAVDAAAVQTAIASALSKFDDVDAAFDAQGMGGVAAMAERLTAEVVADPELALPSDGAAREAAAKEVGVDVKRYVGQAYGAWKKRQAASGEGAARGPPLRVANPV